MNIPSIESLLAELDKYKRAYESADAQILSLKEQRNRLTDERDEWRKDCHAYTDSLRRREDSILELRAELNELEKECQARSPLLMVLAVIREITGTQKQDGDATIAAVKKLVSEVDYWKTIRTENAEYFAKREAELIKERDAALAENAAYYQLAKKEVWAVAEAALREAKEALVMNIVGTGGRTPAAHNAIATINKVLGEE